MRYVIKLDSIHRYRQSYLGYFYDVTSVAPKTMHFRYMLLLGILYSMVNNVNASFPNALGIEYVRRFCFRIIRGDENLEASSLNSTFVWILNIKHCYSQ